MKIKPQQEHFKPDLGGPGRVLAPVRKRHPPTQASLKVGESAMANVF